MNTRLNRVVAGLVAWTAFMSAACLAGVLARQQEGVANPPPARETSSEREVRYQRWVAAHQATTRGEQPLPEGEKGKATRTSDVSPATAARGSILWECAACPQMVLVPAGEFTIGSPLDEAGRGEDEGPQRQVRIPTPLWVGRFEVTRGEYRAFLAAKGRKVSGGCVTDRAHKGTWAPDARTNLNDPGFQQTDNHPVVCVTWDDAKAYVDWLNERTQGGYRLLSEAEWEYVARAGGTETYPWGISVHEGCRYANIGDRNMAARYAGYPYAECNDGALNTTDVGAYEANAFGLYDLLGNTGEWVEDCASMDYVKLPSDGSPNRSGDCSRHIVRGGSWGAEIKDSRVANRIRYPAGQVDDSIGIRVARTL